MSHSKIALVGLHEKKNKSIAFLRRHVLFLCPLVLLNQLILTLALNAEAENN
jgi:hypothetical protein